MILIVEDNDGKIVDIFLKETRAAILRKQEIMIARTELTALDWIENARDPIHLILDYELDIGAGNGVSLLETALKNFPGQIAKVYVHTFSQEARHKMQCLCDDFKIPYEVWR